MPGRTSPLRWSGRTSPLPWAYRTSALDFSRLARAFPNLICLIEIDFDTGTEYYSFEGVGTPDHWYEPLVETVGEIQRESPIFGDEYRVSDVNITLINDQQYFTKKKGTPASFYGRTIRILYGDALDGAARMLPIFTGKIYKWANNERGQFTIQARDFSFDRYRRHVHTTARILEAAVFPDIPVGGEPRLVPIVYGDCCVDPNVDLATYDLGGPIPCYLIDTDAGGKWRYVVAQHICQSVDYVFVYGVKTSAANYTVTNATYDGVSMTVLDFNADPRQSNRSSELEITAAAKGVTDTGLLSGTLLTDPVDVMEHFLLNYASTSSSEIDSATKSVARAASAAAGYACALAIVDKDSPYSEVIARWCQSFLGSVFVTRDSKIGLFVKTTAAPPTPTVIFTADIEMIQDSFSVESNETVASELQYGYMYNYPRDFFGRQPDLTITGQETALGSAISRQVDLYYVRDSATALAVANSHADLLKESVEFQKVDLTPDQFLIVDLNSFVGMTHWQGVAASGGYSGVTVRVYAVGLQPTPTEMKIHAESVKLSA